MPSLCRSDSFCLLEYPEIGYTYDDLLGNSCLPDLAGIQWQYACNRIAYMV